MADGISMPWLGQPADMQAPARAIGTIAGGALRAARPSVRQGRSYLETLPGAMEEASGLQQDPMYLLKRESLKQQIVGIGIQYENQLLQKQLQTKLMGSQANDQRVLAELTSAAGGDPDKLLTGLTEFVPQSPQGLQISTQLRLAASQSLSRKLTAQNNSSILKRAQSLSPENWSTFQSFPKNEDGSYSPQAIEFLGKNAVDASKPSSPLGNLLADRQAAMDAGKQDQVALYDAEIKSRGAKDGISIQFDDQGRPIINYGPNATNIGKPTVATQTATQGRLLKYEAATEILSSLERNLKPEHVGARGAVGEILLDRSLAQLDPRFANKDRIDQRAALTIARESLLREISNDSRFSNADREEISKALPSTGVFESYPDAIQRIQTVRQMLAQRGRTYAEGVGLTRPLWSLSRDEVKAAFDAGQIDEAQALDTLKRFH